jgi:transglutaminase-like putative cysteine protease
MSFNTYFRASSYAMIAVAMLALWLAGGVNLLLAAPFALLMIITWQLEGTKWLLSERTGLIVVLLSLPVFYLDWRFLGPYLDLSVVEGGGSRSSAGVSALAHLILFLSALKLLQIKADRDWVFLYLISFFEVLLSAGLSLSPVFLATLTIYLLCGLSTVIAFEIHKARRNLKPAETRLLVPPDSAIFKRLARRGARPRNIEARRLPVVAVALLALIFALALPLFLVAPRAGSTTFTRGGGGVTNFIGFSESVTLGEIGTLKQNNDVVMHVRIEDATGGRNRDLKWRGVALDEFTAHSWRKSPEARRGEQRISERGFFQLGTTEALHRLTTQTVFLEPIDTPVVFAASRPVALQGPFPFIRIDNEGSIQSRHHELDRVIYKAFSDTTEPDGDVLRADKRPYPASFVRYLQLPNTLDPRIEDLARAVIVNAHARNVYDAAKAIETHLQSDYGYTLEMKAGGRDPLADFLFNVRAGHCEYFSTAMAVMLRTQKIPTRVVNGFLSGEYNDAAGAYTVRQSDAHSWVEVYFAETNSWVTFDPTPAAGRAEPERTGLAAYLGKYSEALELFWFQYVVGYDKQEQRSLATSLNSRLFSYRRSIAAAVANLKQGPLGDWRKVLFAAFVVLAAGLLLWHTRHLGWQRRLRIKRREDEKGTSAVEFYERLTSVLAERGIKRDAHQTPLEFAVGLGLNEVVRVTQTYNRVRFGREKLSPAERRQLEDALTNLKGSPIK